MDEASGVYRFYFEVGYCWVSGVGTAGLPNNFRLSSLLTLFSIYFTRYVQRDGKTETTVLKPVQGNLSPVCSEIARDRVCPAVSYEVYSVWESAVGYHWCLILDVGTGMGII